MRRSLKQQSQDKQPAEDPKEASPEPTHDAAAVQASLPKTVWTIASPSPRPHTLQAAHVKSPAAAATKIQAAFRGMQGRQRAAQQRRQRVLEEKAAVSIQKTWRVCPQLLKLDLPCTLLPFHGLQGHQTRKKVDLRPQTSDARASTADRILKQKKIQDGIDEQKKRLEDEAEQYATIVMHACMHPDVC